MKLSNYALPLLLVVIVAVLAVQAWTWTEAAASRGSFGMLYRTESGEYRSPTRYFRPNFLTDVAPIGGGLFEQRIRLTFRVTNLNDFELPIKGGSFDLTINDTPFARGVSRERVVVPALGEVLLKTEASTTTLGLLNQLRDLSNKREVRYMLSGRFSLDGLHVKSVAFERAADLGPVPFWGDRPVE